jgi:very-short-patch-repair endonuclease
VSGGDVGCGTGITRHRARNLSRATARWSRPERRFAVELDTFETHGNRASFESDRARDLELALAGIETIRVSELQFRREPNAVAATVATLLARRPLDPGAVA